MTFLVERLAELRRYPGHLHELRPRIEGPEVLERDPPVQNDLLFSLLTVCRSLIDIAGELPARRSDRFEGYTQAIRDLATDERFPAELVRRLGRSSWPSTPSGRGSGPYPTVAARLVTGRAHLRAILRRASDAGLGELFVVGATCRIRRGRTRPPGSCSGIWPSSTTTWRRWGSRPTPSATP